MKDDATVSPVHFAREPGVKVVVWPREKVTPMPELLGKFLDESHYPNGLIDYSLDFYLAPECSVDVQNTDCSHECGNCEKGLDERNIVFKYRKNYFTDAEQQSALDGLLEAAQPTSNRGIAAGDRVAGPPAGVKTSLRLWVTDYHHAILDAVLKAQPSLTGEDAIEIARAGFPDEESKKIVSDGNIWKATIGEGFDFDRWVEKEVRPWDIDTRKRVVKEFIKENISGTRYANLVYSGIAGWYDRYPRVPYGRATTYTRDHYDTFSKSFPFLHRLAAAFKELLPWRYSNQMKYASKIDSHFVVPGTPFSTITCNRSFRTAAHYDPANLNGDEPGFANLCCFSDKPDYEGGYLVFPEVGFAINIRPKDLLLVDNMAGLHGNTEIINKSPDAYRFSCIAFFHEAMQELGSFEYEETRRMYCEIVKARQGNGSMVYPQMWESQEWYDFCREKLGEAELIKYHPECAPKVTLDEFFG